MIQMKSSREVAAAATPHSPLSQPPKNTTNLTFIWIIWIIGLAGDTREWSRVGLQPSLGEECHVLG